MSNNLLKITTAAAAMLLIGSGSALAASPGAGTYQVTFTTTNTGCGGVASGTVGTFVFNLAGTGKTGEFSNIPIGVTADPELQHVSYSSAFPTANGTWKGTASAKLITDGGTTTLSPYTFTFIITFNDANSFFGDYSDSNGCTANQVFIKV